MTVLNPSIPVFTCEDCGNYFSITPGNLGLNPNWQPRRCEHCKQGSPRERRLTATEVLGRYEGGPHTGIFTHGFCEPNPGPGGWSAVQVISGGVLRELSGTEPATTNIRMDWRSLIGALSVTSTKESWTIYSQSQGSVLTLTEWAPRWSQNGWRGHRGKRVENVDLIQEALELYNSRPNVKVTWINAHSGLRWPAYAEAISRTHLFGAV